MSLSSALLNRGWSNRLVKNKLVKLPLQVERKVKDFP